MEFLVRIEARLAGRVVKTRDVAMIARPGVVMGGEEWAYRWRMAKKSSENFSPA